MSEDQYETRNLFFPESRFTRSLHFLNSCSLEKVLWSQESVPVPNLVNQTIEHLISFRDFSYLTFLFSSQTPFYYRHNGCLREILRKNRNSKITFAFLDRCYTNHRTFQTLCSSTENRIITSCKIIVRRLPDTL